MSVADTFKNFLRSRALADQLAEIRRRRADADAELRRIDGEMARLVLPMMIGRQRRNRPPRLARNGAY